MAEIPLEPYCQAARTTAYLGELIEQHGIQVVTDGEWLTFPEVKPGLRANAEFVRHGVQVSGMTMQLDVRLQIDADRMIVESFAGFGSTQRECANEAFENFSHTSLHVLLAVFFGQVELDQIEVTEQVIGNHNRKVTIGKIGVRGQLPQTAEDEPDISWVNDYHENLSQQRIPAGLHWVRLFVMFAAEKMICCELLLDNEPWPAMQKLMRRVHWPTHDSVYGVRLFLIVEDA